MSLVIVVFALIGLVAIFVFILSNHEKRTEARMSEEREIRSFIKYSERAQEFIADRNKDIEHGNPVITQSQMLQEVKKIMESSTEAMQITKKIEGEYANEQESKERLNDFNRRVMRLYYLYYELLFETFNGRKELPKDEIIDAIKSGLNVDTIKATEVFNEWDSLLVEECNWNENFKIAGEFFDDTFQSDDKVLTYELWLRKNDKILQRPTQDEINWEQLRESNYELWRKKFNEKSRQKRNRL